MTDEQFKTLRSIQFAQLALLQSIASNIRLIAEQQGTGQPAGINWRETHALVEGVRNWKRPGTGLE